MSGETYHLVTLKDVFDKVPREKIRACMLELAKGMDYAKALEALAGAKVGWPESIDWIDDDMGQIDVGVNAGGERVMTLRVKAEGGGGGVVGQGKLQSTWRAAQAEIDEQQRVNQRVKSELDRRADAMAAHILALREMPEDMRELSVRMECEFLMREVWRAAWLSGFRAAASGAGRCEIDAVRAA